MGHQRQIGALSEQDRSKPMSERALCVLPGCANSGLLVQAAVL
jgi:hypothetical protein